MCVGGGGGGGHVVVLGVWYSVESMVRHSSFKHGMVCFLCSSATFRDTNVCQDILDIAVDR